MARSFAKVATTIWDNPDFRALTAKAQRLYFQILSQKRLTLAGVVPYSPRAWARGCDTITITDIEQNTQELAAAEFVIVDYDTEELMVRTMLKHDPIRGARTVAGLWNAWSEIDSPTIRQLVIHSIPDELWDTEGVEPPEPAKALRNTPSDTPSEGVCNPSFPIENEKRAAYGLWPTAHGLPPIANASSSRDNTHNEPEHPEEEEETSRRTNIAHTVATLRARDRNDIRDPTGWITKVTANVLDEHGEYIDQLITQFNPAPDNVLAAAVCGDKHSLGHYRTPTEEIA